MPNPPVFAFPPPGWPSNTVNNDPKHDHSHPRITITSSSPQPTRTYPSQPHPTLLAQNLQPIHRVGQMNYAPVPTAAAGSYRPNYSQPTPTRTNSSNAPVLYGNSRQSVPNGNTSAIRQPPQPRQTYYQPSTHAPGPLGFFLPPPGQPTTDPSLSTPPTTQACYTTYPSRLRTGVTGLIQPEHVTGGPRERELFLADYEREMRGGSGASTPRFDSPTPFGGAAARRPPAVTTLSGRRGRVVNYAENVSEEEEDEEEEESELSELDEPGSDPEDKSYGARAGRSNGNPRPSRRIRDDSLTFGGDHQSASKMGKLKRKRDEMDKGWTWLGDRTPGERVRSQHAKPTKHSYSSEEMLEHEANRPELLVPITVDLDIPSLNPDTSGIKIKDRFLWNLNEPFVDPLRFSEVFCEDVGIPAHHAATIAELIKTQLEEAQNAVEIDIANPDVTEDDVVWSDDEVEGVMDNDIVAELPDGEVVEEQEVKEKERIWAESDCRIIVNLDVQIYTHLLRDRIEWDLSSSLPPSMFAKQYCSELGLTGEAIPLITFAIHEELLRHKRDALELDLFMATHPEEQAKWEKVSNFHGGPGIKVSNKLGCKELNGVWRDWGEREEFQPVLIELTMDDMEKRELERTREARRIMRTLTTSKRRR